MDERSDQSVSTLSPRAAALILWLVLAEAWLLRHAGAGFEDQLKLIHAPALLAIATAGLDWLLSTSEAEKVRMSLRTWLRRRAISTPFLISLFTVSFAGAAMVSSINVASGLSGQKVTLVHGEDTQVLEYEGERLRKLVWPIHPFGTPFELRVEGYVPFHATLYPLVGTRVSADQDLTTATTLLLRPIERVLHLLTGAGRLRVLRESVDGCFESVAEGGGVRSKRLGSPRPLPDGSVKLWELDQLQRGNDPIAAARMLLGWAQPEDLALAVGVAPLVPGNRLVIEVLDADGCQFAALKTKVDRVPFRDIVIGEKEHHNAMDLQYCAGVARDNKCSQN